MNDLAILSTLLLSRPEFHQPLSAESVAANREKALVNLARFNRVDFPRLAEFASHHHVIVRALEVLYGLAAAEKDQGRIRQAGDAIDRERNRIAHALSVLEAICQQCELDGHKIVVIKSLDHWPDLGSDLDLYTDAAPVDILHIMAKKLNARPAERSWGDRLAGKWNFIVPGLPELVEFHVGRLGQTGEQVEIARHLLDRAVFTLVGAHRFRIPAPEDRLMISTLQRMYRHFYFRLCDIVDTAHLLEGQAFDFTELRTSAERAGIWQGTATYLAIVSDYLAKYRGNGLALPSFVKAAAQFGGDAVSFRKGFLRVPIVPHSVRLFVAELSSVAGRRNIRSAARLSMLPWLAAAAAVSQKLSGSDKGIW
jgi:hypothetical protein